MNGKTGSSADTAKLIICLAEVVSFILKSGISYPQSTIDRFCATTGRHVSILPIPIHIWQKRTNNATSYFILKMNVMYMYKV